MFLTIILIRLRPTLNRLLYFLITALLFFCGFLKLGNNSTICTQRMGLKLKSFVRLVFQNDGVRSWAERGFCSSYHIYLFLYCTQLTKKETNDVKIRPRQFSRQRKYNEN